MVDEVNVKNDAGAQPGLNEGLDADREIIADAMAFRALATMPSLWQLTLMFGAPHFQMNIAWGTGAGIEIREYDIQENRVLALRKLIHKAQAEVMNAGGAQWRVERHHDK